MLIRILLRTSTATLSLPGHGRHSKRAAYTLLEVLLATAIGVILLGALYVSMDLQLRHTKTGRELIEQGTLVRALLARISTDINSSIGPTQLTISGSSGGAGGGTAAAPSSTPSTTPAAGTSSGGGTSSGSGTATPAASSTPASSSAVQVNLGVQGDASRLILTVSKLPRELILSPNASQDNQPIVSDLRRITFWLAGGSGTPLGLARQEIKVATSDDASIIPPDIPDEPSYVIAEEVRSLTFRYFDGTSWQDSWDGTQPGADGTTPQGPPLAIEIVIGVAQSGSNNGSGGEPKVKSYRHVVAIQTANGATQANNSSNSNSNSNSGTSP